MVAWCLCVIRGGLVSLCDSWWPGVSVIHGGLVCLCDVRAWVWGEPVGVRETIPEFLGGLEGKG